MRHILLLSLGLACLLTWSLSAQESEYADVKEVLVDFIDATVEIVELIDMADDAGDVADAFDVYVDLMTDFVAAMNAFEKQYPEIEDNVPDDLQAMLDDFEKTMMSFGGIAEKLVEFSHDERIRKAMERLEELE